MDSIFYFIFLSVTKSIKLMKEGYNKNSTDHTTKETQSGIKELYHKKTQIT